MKNTPIYTIGHGNLHLEKFILLLKSCHAQYLIDIRSVPFSRYNPQYNQNELDFFLKKNGITYVYMGDLLGGRPEDISCYVDGKVQYEIIKEKDFFKQGISRLQTALQKCIPIILMCSESKPEECHRSKLIGEYLDAQNVEIIHIDEKGNEVTQREVMLAVTKGKGTIDIFGAQEFYTSRKSYR